MKAFKSAALMLALSAALAGCSCSKQDMPAPSTTPAPSASMAPAPSLTPSPTPSPIISPVPSAVPLPEGMQSFTPGKYMGKGDGMNGTLTVETEFDEKKIVSVKLKEHNETAGIYEKAEEEITKQIVEKQSLNIDAVSGATYTSNAILEAVEDCVKQAGGDLSKLKQ